MTAEKRFEIRTLQGDEPVAQISLGPAKIIQTHKNLIHIIRLQEYQEAIENIEQTLREVVEDAETKDLVRVLQNKLHMIKARLEAICPKSRRTRGLINGLGSVVKSITGNLDAEDAERLEEEIRKTQEEEKILRETMNAQERTGVKFSIMFKNLTKYINEEQTRVTMFINNYRNGISKTFLEEDKRIYRLEYIDRISVTIDMLGLNINDIAESLLLAKIGLISKFIFDKQETTKCVQELEGQGINITSEEHMYEFLELKAIMNRTDIIFSIKLPVFKKGTYSLQRIIALPMNKTEYVLAPEYIVNNEEEIYYYKEKCLKIRNLFTCKNEKIVNQVNEKCIRKLISGEEASCETKDVGLVSRIFEPEEGYIAIFNGENIKVQTDCGHERTINGSALITFRECRAMVKNIQYGTLEKLGTVRLNLQIPQIKAIQKNRTTQELGIHELKMEDIETKIQINRIQTGTAIHATATYTMLTVLLIVVTAVACLSKRTTTFTPAAPLTSFTPTIGPPATFTPTIAPLWSVVQSEGGGVTASALTLGGPPPKPLRLA